MIRNKIASSRPDISHRTIVLLAGSAIILVWTLLRHITNGINFDVVGQVGLVEQWQHGLRAGAQIGPTNYLLKMPLYALVNTIHAIAPMNRLLLLAALCNVATFVLAFFILDKIRQLYHDVATGGFYLAVLWFATIYGGFAWADYANSRNVETLGGLLCVYFVLKYARYGRATDALTLGVTASVTFFADPLQAYVYGLGIFLYYFYGWLRVRNRDNWNLFWRLTAALSVSFGLSKLLFWIARAVLPVTFLNVPTVRPHLSGGSLRQALSHVGAASLQIYNADFLKRPYGPNTLRELLNAAILGGIIIAAVKLVRRKNHSGRPYGLLLSIGMSNLLVYVVSGQAFQVGTARYLFMIVLMSLVFIAWSASESSNLLSRKLYYIWLGMIIVSGLLLLGALVHDWPVRHSKDQPIYQTLAYLQRGHYHYALTTRQIGVTTTYIADDAVQALPVRCSAEHAISADTLFYDKGAFSGLDRYTEEVPIILQNNTITTGSNVCSQADIITQLGEPRREEFVPGIGYALIYTATNVRNVR